MEEDFELGEMISDHYGYEDCAARRVTRHATRRAGTAQTVKGREQQGMGLVVKTVNIRCAHGVLWMIERSRSQSRERSKMARQGCSNTASNTTSIHCEGETQSKLFLVGTLTPHPSRVY